MSTQFLENLLDLINFDEYPSFKITISGVTPENEEHLLIETNIKNPGRKSINKMSNKTKQNEINLDGIINLANDIEIDLSKIKYKRLANTYTMKDYKMFINHITNNNPGFYLDGRTKKQLVDTTLELIKKYGLDESNCIF